MVLDSGWWKKGSDFMVPAIQIDSDPRHDLEQFDEEIYEKKMHEMVEKYPQNRSYRVDFFCLPCLAECAPSNRLVGHLVGCAENYYCLPAINFFMGRWEVPLLMRL